MNQRTKSLLLTHLGCVAIGALIMMALNQRTELVAEMREEAVDQRVKTEVVTRERIEYVQGPKVDTSFAVPQGVPVVGPELDSLLASLPPGEPLGIPSDTPRTMTVEGPHVPDVNRYTQVYEDSLLTTEIVATVDGRLLGWDFEYTPTFPTRIIETTNTVTVTNTIRPPTTALLLGAKAWGVFGPETLAGVGPSIGLRRGMVTLNYTPSIPLLGLSPGVYHAVEAEVTVPLGL